MSQFSVWVDKELERRDWNRAELSRRSGISQAALSHIWKGDRNPGKDVCQSIAMAFNTAPEIVFRIAGLLPEQTYDEERRQTIIHLVGELDPDLYDIAIHQMRALVEMRNQQKQQAAVDKRKKTGPLPGGANAL